MKKYFPIILMSALLLAANLKAKAQVFAKLPDSKAVPLRVQSLNAKVEIVGAVAITDWTMEIQMENLGYASWYDEGAVCDFICARPRDAKVTAFRVNAWQTELPGRVEERAILAPRVAFHAAKNDPLVRSGLNAGNSFRATIYPINYWGNITIHTTWVQSLTSTKAGASYRLPLLALRGATTRLPELNVTVTARDAALPAISNNYELPIQTQEGVRVFSLSQKNYRVTRDLTVMVKPAMPSSGIAMLVAPDAAMGGHFALAFVAPRPLKNFAVSGSGIQGTPTFSPGSVKTGDVVLASGNYSGDPKNISAQLSATGLANAPLVPIQNEAANSLWATQKINVLGASARANRAQIIALSKKYSVISPFTSWLALSANDLKFYRYALVSSQLDPLVREYWMRVGAGQGKGLRVTQLKKAITRISLGNGLVAQDEIYARLGSALKFAAVGYYEGPAPLGKRYTRLEKEAEAYQKRVATQQKNQNLEELRTKIAAEYSKSHPNYTQLSEWERTVARSDIGPPNPHLALWRLHIAAQDLEAQTTAAEKAGDKVRLAKLQEDRDAYAHSAFAINNVGDPPIYVSAPADARQVVAVMPDGRIKTLDYNRWQKRWEGNYDVPVGTKDGAYKIQIVVVNADGSRQRYARPFRVDTKAPTSTGAVELASQLLPTGERAVRLEVLHSGDVAFVTALLPWGEKVSLLPSTVRGDTFFALVRVPRDYQSKTIKVTYILTDGAHNITSIEAESGSISPAPVP